ncbi:hypothetical protein MY10362_001090 [Beauveria mimosiformis]
MHASLAQGIEPNWVAPSSVKGLTSYPIPGVGYTPKSCTTCGCHVGAVGNDDGTWTLATAILKEHGHDIVNVVSHVFNKSAGDGGLAGILTHMQGKALGTWNPEDDQPNAAAPKPKLEVGSDGQERLRAQCHCGGVSFTIPRPSKEIAEHAYAKRFVSPLDPTKWYGTLDMCDDCRLINGAPVASWIFVPTNAMEPAVGEHLMLGTMKTYASSEEIPKAILALIGSTTACIHGDALHARRLGPSLDWSTRYVPRQNQQNQVNIFFGRIQNVGAEIYGCYAGGSDDADKIPQGIQPTSVNLNGEGFDPNLNLGVMVYYIKASQNSVFMFDTSTAEVLAESCNQELQQQTGLGIDMIILSHEHGDHVAGRNANSLKRVPVMAQSSLVQKLGARGGGNVPLSSDQSLTFQMQDGVMNVTNVQAHTKLGTVAMINGVALMGDELESTVNFLVSSNTQRQNNQLQISQSILGENNIQTVLPAHGSGAAMFAGQFSLQLLQSNQRYLELMATNPQSVCPQNKNGRQLAQAKAQLGRQIGVRASDITDAYFETHINENCQTVGASA